VILQNHSPNADAVNVNVLVNFVLADNNLIGSSSTNIPLIPAGSTYTLGSNLGFPGAAPVDRLESVIQVAGRTKHAAGHQPALANVAIEPSLYDPGWVGDVAGEVINNDAQMSLQSTSFSAVILDSTGNVVGGGNGNAAARNAHGLQADRRRVQRHPARQGRVRNGHDHADLEAGGLVSEAQRSTPVWPSE